MSAPIKHVFVLMLENRSFDHLLGYLPHVNGVTKDMSNPNPSANGPHPVLANPGATDRAEADPKHEFKDVWTQLYGKPPVANFTGGSAALPTMDGFVASGGPEAMACFKLSAVPVLALLAQSFLVLDCWHASMPGPTWPNRFFVHAGSSGGLTNSPSPLASLEGVTIADLSFGFSNGTIYDRLDDQRLPWRVFHGDAMPQVLAVKRHVMPFIACSKNFASITPSDPNDPFATQLNARTYDAAYTFIEPDYNIATNMYFGNSQHPRGSVSKGEMLIKYVYETLRNSRVWEESLLLITYDEHGGFFDHVVPQRCPAPGDVPLNYDRAEKPCPFDFRRYGVRVPAVLVSPFVDAGVNSGLFDHTSILKTLTEIFPSIGSLTKRDEAASSLLPLLERPKARLTDAEAPMKLIASSPPPVTAAPLTLDPNDPPDATLAGFTRIAASLDIGMSHLQLPRPTALVLEDIRLPVQSVRTAQESLDYIQQVLKRLRTYQTSTAMH
jgi:phospholipase C